MTRPRVHLIALVAILSPLCLAQQERGAWRAASKSAASITGDVAIGNEKISINFASYPLAQIKVLTPLELSAAFDADSNAGGIGSLYRLSVPGAKKLLHGNTLCAGDETQWVATYVAGKTLQLAFFSGAAMPVFTIDALGSSTNLCGTYTYAR